MSVTVINDWRFLPRADLEEGIQAMRDYIDYLRDEEPELEQSLWLRSQDEPLRHFHIATYSTREALERQRGSAGTLRFVERLYPLIDEGSLVQPTGEVVANTGAGPGEV